MEKLTRARASPHPKQDVIQLSTISPAVTYNYGAQYTIAPGVNTVMDWNGDEVHAFRVAADAGFPFKGPVVQPKRFTPTLPVEVQAREHRR